VSVADVPSTPAPLDDRELIRYLLGQASAEEQTSLEDRYLLDDELTEKIRSVESELIAAYWRDRLSPEDREAFEGHYLAAPARRERADFEKMLLDYASHTTRDRAAAPPAITRPIGRATSWPLAAGWAAVLLVASAATFELVRIRGELAVVRAQLAEVRAQRMSPGAGPIAGPATNLKEWVRLRPGRVRDGRSGQAPSMHASPNPLTLRLDVPVAGPGPYRLIAQTAEGREVWRTDQAVAERTLDGWAVFGLIDRTLDPGDYVFTLRAQGTAGRPGADVAEYFLRINP
jgi:hypothetical protein